MSKLIYKRFYELSAHWQKQLNEDLRSYALQKRAELIAYLEKYSNCTHAEAVARADDCWWSKIEYCEQRSYDSDYLLSTCSKCGCPTKLMKCLYDKPADLDRDCGYLCTCGERFDHIYE